VAAASNDTRDLDTGMSIGWRGVENMLFDESLMRSGRVELGTGTNKRYSRPRAQDPGQPVGEGMAEGGTALPGCVQPRGIRRGIVKHRLPPLVPLPVQIEVQQFGLHEGTTLEVPAQGDHR
jgi:hypothetical protein